MKTAAAVFAFLVAAGSAGAATHRLEAGLWRLKTVITNNGVPDPIVDEKLCVSAEELEDLDVYFALAPEGVPGKCTSARVPADGENVMKFRMRCAGPGFTTDLRATVTITSPRNYRVDARADARDHGKPVVAITKAEAQRIGPCPKS
jgi:hypothetical protein